MHWNRYPAIRKGLQTLFFTAFRRFLPSAGERPSDSRLIRTGPLWLGQSALQIAHVTGSNLRVLGQIGKRARAHSIT